MMGLGNECTPVGVYTMGLDICEELVIRDGIHLDILSDWSLGIIGGATALHILSHV